MPYEKGWFNKLCNGEGKSLMERCEIQYGNIIICKAQKYHSFKLFDDYLEFGNYMYSVKINQRNFFECIFQFSPQKFYLDIDSSREYIELEEADKMVVRIRNALRDLIFEISKKYFPILVFTSHGSEEDRDDKISYHIIVDRLCLLNAIQGKILFEKLMERLEERDKCYIDSSLFKSKQQMRIWTCTKHGKNRHKKLSYLSVDPNNDPLNIPGGGDKEIFLSILGSSLISNTSICEFLPVFPEPPKKEYISDPDAIVDIGEDLINEVFDLYCKYHNLKECPFEFKDSLQEENDRAMILCKRIHPSFCVKCERIHEHENPFFTIAGKKYDVFFGCRRSNKTLFLGSLREAQEIEESEEEEQGDVFEDLKNIKNSPKKKFELGPIYSNGNFWKNK